MLNPCPFLYLIKFVTSHLKRSQFVKLHYKRFKGNLLQIEEKDLLGNLPSWVKDHSNLQFISHFKLWSIFSELPKKITKFNGVTRKTKGNVTIRMKNVRGETNSRRLFWVIVSKCQP